MKLSSAPNGSSSNRIAGFLTRARASAARILAPAALPSYFTGLPAGLALGWMFVIAAELMGASQGLGFLMTDGEMTGRPAIIIGSLILFAIMGKVTDAILVSVGRSVLSWQDDFASLQGRPVT
jgi:sulfonate transport system permease protein